ncbi:hypothetical protein ABZ915_06330 [Streptomyces sp. NPDC046915]|uniref:hypothetical protein n=1 Tax=Streptomyces sp. NPDC046915 TaxID=3155257 RepID=UPI0033D06BCF
MRALPARRIASSTLCAALLVGITGPAAMAADPARERGHAVSPDAPRLSAHALLAQVRKLNAFGSEVTPVTDLLNAVLKADHGRLSAAEARRLGDPAKRALAKVVAKAEPRASARRAAAPADLLDDLEKALDDLLESLTGGTDQVLPSLSGLLGDLIDLLTGALIDGALPTPAASTPEALEPADTLPAVTVPAVTPPVVTLPAPVQAPAS